MTAKLELEQQFQIKVQVLQMCLRRSGFGFLKAVESPTRFRVKQGLSMPEKQTRESIEAELNTTESERLIEMANEIKREAQELEADLQRLEQERGLPVDPTKPQLERMAALGVSKQAIDRLSSLDDAMDHAMDKVRLGRMGKITEDIRRKFAESADAEISALDQLQDVLDARRSK